MKQSHHTHLAHAHTHLILPELVRLLGFTKKRSYHGNRHNKSRPIKVFNVFMTFSFCN